MASQNPLSHFDNDEGDYFDRSDEDRIGNSDPRDHLVDDRDPHDQPFNYQDRSLRRRTQEGTIAFDTIQHEDGVNFDKDDEDSGRGSP
ncbi:hypothetical protein BG011_003635, partial [Mortierella polycephala]